MRTLALCLFLISFLNWSLNSFAESGSPVPTAAEAANSARPKIVFIGDSLADGYGVVRTESFPQVIEQMLAKSGHPSKVINGGISGSLSSSTASRVRFYLKTQPQIIVLELGGNDALKGTPANLIEKNLQEGIDLALKAGVQVLLLGIQVYSNFGQTYNHELSEIYKDLAKKNKLKLMPFVLEGVGDHPELMQADAKHPNSVGHKIVAQNVYKYLEPMVIDVEKHITVSGERK